MEDILCDASTADILADCFKLLQEQLELAGLCIAPDKIQTTTSTKYLAAIVDRRLGLQKYRLGEINSLL